MLISWAPRALKRNTFNTNVNILTKLRLPTCIYIVWLERNPKIYNQSSRTEEDMIKLIFQELRYRILSLPKKSGQFFLLFDKGLWSYGSLYCNGENHISGNFGGYLTIVEDRDWLQAVILRGSLSIWLRELMRTLL